MQKVDETFLKKVFEIDKALENLATLQEFPYSLKTMLSFIVEEIADKDYQRGTVDNIEPDDVIASIRYLVRQLDEPIGKITLATNSLIKMIEIVRGQQVGLANEFDYYVKLLTDSSGELCTAIEGLHSIFSMVLDQTNKEHLEFNDELYQIVEVISTLPIIPRFSAED